MVNVCARAARAPVRRAGRENGCAKRTDYKTGALWEADNARLGEQVNVVLKWLLEPVVCAELSMKKGEVGW